MTPEAILSIFLAAIIALSALLGIRAAFLSTSEGNIQSVTDRVRDWMSSETKKKETKHRFQWVASVTPERLRESLELSLSAAGIPLEPEEALLLLVITLFLAGITGFVLFSIAGMLVGFLVGFAVPVYVFRFRKNRRQKKLDRQIPTLLDLLSSGMRAGFSLLQAMQHAGSQMAAPLGPTLSLVVAEMTVGLEPETALRRWVARTGSMDLEMAVAAILIQREVGGNLAELLDNISSIMRDRQEAEMEMKSLTAQGRMEGLVISLLPIVIAIALFLMSPDYMRPLFETQTGHRLLIASVVMGAIGILIVRKLATPKY
jgi:tight adherence protein B